MSFSLMVLLIRVFGVDVARYMVDYICIDDRRRFGMGPRRGYFLGNPVRLPPRCPSKAVRLVGSLIPGHYERMRFSGYEISFPGYQYRVMVQECVNIFEMEEFGGTDWAFREAHPSYGRDYNVLIEIFNNIIDLELHYFEYNRTPDKSSRNARYGNPSVATRVVKFIPPTTKTTKYMFEGKRFDWEELEFRSER